MFLIIDSFLALSEIATDWEQERFVGVAFQTGGFFFADELAVYQKTGFVWLIAVSPNDHEDVLDLDYSVTVTS